MKESSWRVVFRCDPYRAQSHFLWVNAPDDTTDKEIMRAAYDYKGGLPVDVIDGIRKWSYTVDKPDLTITAPNP